VTLYDRYYSYPGWAYDDVAFIGRWSSHYTRRLFRDSIQTTFRTKSSSASGCLDVLRGAAQTDCPLALRLIVYAAKITRLTHIANKSQAASPRCDFPGIAVVSDICWNKRLGSAAGSQPARDIVGSPTVLARRFRPGQISTATQSNFEPRLPGNQHPHGEAQRTSYNYARG